MFDIRMEKKFRDRIIDLDWSQVIFAVSKKWFDKSAAVDYALEKLDSGAYSTDELDLAGTDWGANFEIEYILRKLSRIHTAEIDQEKWMKILLAWLYENRDLIEDPLGEVEEIYEDFEYPDLISTLVRYLPYEGPPEDMMELWKKFLDNNVYSEVISRV